MVLGFIVSVPLLYFTYNSSEVNFDAAPLPTGYASLLAISIGLFVPAVSSIIPIKRALSKNLNESINDQRSKNSGLAVKIFNSEKSMMLPVVIFGSIATLGCTVVYYYLPKAFLTNDYSLLLNMFFLILTALILGITLLMNNLQGVVEFLLAKVGFFWD